MRVPTLISCIDRLYATVIFGASHTKVNWLFDVIRSFHSLVHIKQRVYDAKISKFIGTWDNASNSVISIRHYRCLRQCAM
jgi:hypothetical protein